MSAIDEVARSMIEAVGRPPLGTWSGYTNNRDGVVLAIWDDQVRWGWSTKSHETWSRPQMRIGVRDEGSSRIVVLEPSVGRPQRITLADPARAESLRAALGQAGGRAGEPSAVVVVTLPTVPGHRIVAVHGVVSAIGSLSGWTASVKGRGALERAFPELVDQARSFGANAVVGLHCSAYGAAGGITNMVGGDAVGVLLMGTAVSIEAESAESSGSPTGLA